MVSIFDPIHYHAKVLTKIQLVHAIFPDDNQLLLLTNQNLLAFYIVSKWAENR